jgi:hypothetical protein
MWLQRFAPAPVPPAMVGGFLRLALRISNENFQTQVLFVFSDKCQKTVTKRKTSDLSYHTKVLDGSLQTKVLAREATNNISQKEVSKR